VQKIHLILLPSREAYPQTLADGAGLFTGQELSECRGGTKYLPPAIFLGRARHWKTDICPPQRDEPFPDGLGSDVGQETGHSGGEGGVLAVSLFDEPSQTGVLESLEAELSVHLQVVVAPGREHHLPAGEILGRALPVNLPPSDSHEHNLLFGTLDQCSREQKVPLLSHLPCLVSRHPKALSCLLQ
jgi:hypothetical protein